MNFEWVGILCSEFDPTDRNLDFLGTSHKISETASPVNLKG